MHKLKGSSNIKLIRTLKRSPAGQSNSVDGTLQVKHISVTGNGGHCWLSMIRFTLLMRSLHSRYLTSKVKHSSTPYLNSKIVMLSLGWISTRSTPVYSLTSTGFSKMLYHFEYKARFQNLISYILWNYDTFYRMSFVYLRLLKKISSYV